MINFHIIILIFVVEVNIQIVLDDKNFHIWIFFSVKLSIFKYCFVSLQRQNKGGNHE